MNKKRKPESTKKLREQLDYYFQEFIRYRDNHTCITCGAKYLAGERGKLHAGHYISRTINSTRWDEENVNGQCASCNMKQSHCDIEVINEYTRQLKLKYGDDVIDRLMRKKHEILKINKTFLREQIEIYKQALEFKKGQ